MREAAGLLAMIDSLRQALSAASLDKYADAVIAELPALQELSSSDQGAHLKSACGVTTLGHRHRLVKLLAELDAPPPDISDAAAASSSSLAPASAPYPIKSNGVVPSHITAMVSKCEPLKGPLPFMGDIGNNPDDIPAGTHLPLNPNYPGVWRVHNKPSLFIVEDLLTSDECDALMRLADPLMLQSLTHGGDNRNTRTSKTCHLRKTTFPCPSVISKVERLTNKPSSHMETPQVARYESGQFYSMHFDGPGGSSLGDEKFREAGGQRVATVLIYLNDVQKGGSTRFNRLGIEVTPRKGCACVFFPGMHDTGALDPRALHEARPAVDKKYVCQIWVRQTSLPPDADGKEDGFGMGHKLLAALYDK